MKAVIGSGFCSAVLVLSLNGLALAATPKPKSCTIAVNAKYRELSTAARSCKNAKDNVVPLKSQKTNVLYGSSDDLFNLSLDRIGASESDLAQISAAEAEIVSTRDSLLNDLNGAIEESNADALDVCQTYTSKTSEYNTAVNSCAKAKKKTVTLSCNVSLRYSKRDASIAKKRCDQVTKLVTNMTNSKTSALADIDATLADYRKALEKATNDADQKEIRDAITALENERKNQNQYFTQGISASTTYKGTVCNESSATSTAYNNLVKSCKK